MAAYIDTLSEAQKVLVQQAGASLFTIAKDVKLQVEFNPATVAEYRLVGYETRALKREDFNNDEGRCGRCGRRPHGDRDLRDHAGGLGDAWWTERRYATDAAERAADAAAGTANEYGFLKIRYKLPDSNTSELIEQPILARAARRAGQRAARRAVLDRGRRLRPAAARRPLHRRNWSYEDDHRAGPGLEGRGPLWLPHGVRAAGAQGAGWAREM